MKIKQLKELIRPFDVACCLFFLMASFIPMGIFMWQQLAVPENATRYAVVSIDGVEIDRFELDEELDLIYMYTAYHGLTGDQYNIIEISDGRIRVKEDNSPDQIGVNMGWIARPGQTIVVLPHRFLIRIEAVGVRDDVEEIIIPF